MEQVEKMVAMVRASYGKPREGFEEFLKTCERLDPMCGTVVPKLCKGYRLPEDLILHEIMIQPYYDSRVMKARDTDTLVVSYAKTGTTWTQEICYLIANDADVAKARAEPLEDRCPFIEIPSIGGIKGIDERADPRVIKSHLPYHLLPEDFLKKKTKIVYIARNPKDTLISYFFFLRMMGYFGLDESLKEFLDRFVTGEILYSSYAKHVLSFWERRNDGNVLFLTYEELKKDLRAGVAKIAKFMEKDLTDEQLDVIAENTTFESMAKNPMTNYTRKDEVTAVIPLPNTTEFMRKGQVSDWKNHFDDEMAHKMQEYIDKYFKPAGINFQYEL